MILARWIFFLDATNTKTPTPLKEQSGIVQTVQCFMRHEPFLFFICLVSVSFVSLFVWRVSVLLTDGIGNALWILTRLHSI